jgi:hypothetical protein
MYQFSRAIYRELADAILEDDGPGTGSLGNHERVLRACESAVERLAHDRHYFARPARTLFHDIRAFFPVCAQRRVLRVIEHYVAAADAWLAQQPSPATPCRATTRRGTPCQRAPLAHNGYCPSHQHLAETEGMRAGLVA